MGNGAVPPLDIRTSGDQLFLMSASPSHDTSSTNPRRFIEVTKTLLYGLLIAVVIRSFAAEAFEIPSGSMVPTLDVGDFLIVSKFSYGYSAYSLPVGLPLFTGRVFGHAPRRGDVVVFKWPRDTSVNFVKRVIGLPGDRIQVLHGLLYVNGVPVERKRLDDVAFRAGAFTLHAAQYIETLPNGPSYRVLQFADDGPLDNTQVFVVPADHYFMMGDNRDDSADSRDPGSGVGFVPAQNLIGPAEFKLFSINLVHPAWQFWYWPFEIRYSQLFERIS